MLDHYLEVLTRKPGALAGATALAAARASGAFTGDHQRFWDAARRRLGDGAGTRALVGVLLLHRTLPAGRGDRPAWPPRPGWTASMPTWSPSRPAAPSIPAPPPPPRRGAAGRRPAGAVAGRLRPAPDRGVGMTAAAPVSRLAEPAADAAIEAAAKTLQLPTIRAQASVMAAAAAKQRLSHKAFLAEMLTAECDERDARRRLRLVNEAKFPRTKRLADFDHTRIGDLTPAVLGHLAAGSLDRRRRTPGAARRLRHRQDPPADRARHLRRRSTAAGSATPPAPNWSTSSPRPPTTNNSPGSSAATPASTCSASTRSAT